VRRTLRAVGRRWRLVAITMVGAAVLAVAGTVLTPPIYTATGQAFVAVSEPETRPPYELATGSQFILKRMTSYSSLADTSRVLDPVISSLELDETTESLRRDVFPQAQVNTSVIDVSVQNEDPELAARIADATLAELAEAVQELDNDTTHVTVADATAVPTAPSNKSTLRNGALAGAGGLVVGVVIAVLLGLRDERRRARGAPG
jgi:capsular polysaccharide biosynthesis protein